MLLNDKRFVLAISIFVLVFRQAMRTISIFVILNIGFDANI
jgi:hypothetical protein